MLPGWLLGIVRRLFCASPCCFAKALSWSAKVAGGTVPFPRVKPTHPHHPSPVGAAQQRRIHDQERSNGIQAQRQYDWLNARGASRASGAHIVLLAGTSRLDRHASTEEDKLWVQCPQEPQRFLEAKFCLILLLSLLVVGNCLRMNFASFADCFPTSWA
jgi:hypothetical protein